MRIRIRLTPGARKDDFGGLFIDADGRTWLKASVRATPTKGKANAALIEALSEATGLAASRIALKSGELARIKTLEIGDCSEAELAAFEALAKA